MKSKLEKIKAWFVKDNIRRIYRTFLQVGISTIATYIATVDMNDESEIRGIIIIALTTAVSAVMNLPKREDENDDN